MMASSAVGHGAPGGPAPAENERREVCAACGVDLTGITATYGTAKHLMQVLYKAREEGVKAQSGVADRGTCNLDTVYLSREELPEGMAVSDVKRRSDAVEERLASSPPFVQKKVRAHRRTIFDEEVVSFIFPGACTGQAEKRVAFNEAVRLIMRQHGYDAQILSVMD